MKHFFAAILFFISSYGQVAISQSRIHSDHDLISRLVCLDKVNPAVIEDFFWTKDSCDLISMEEAIAIAKRQNLKTAIDSLKATIKYDLQTKAFSWEVSQTLWNKKNELNDNYGEREIVTIDAKTGEVLSHACKHYTPVY